MSIRQAFELAVQKHRAGQLADAERIYRQILAQSPDEPDAIQLLGLVAHETGRHAEAVPLLERAVALKPDVADYRNSLGVAYWGAEDYLSAAGAYGAATKLNPRHMKAWYNLGMTLRFLGKTAAAIDALEQAIDLDPGAADAHLNLGIALKDVGRLDEAIEAYHTALRLNPGDAVAHYNLGFARSIQGNLDQAIAHYRQAIALRPLEPAFHSQLLQSLLYDPAQTPQSILDEHLCWSRQHAKPLARFIAPHSNNRNPDRPLRIGYVSADFRNHACAFCLEHVIAHHDRAQFITVCYAEVAQPDDITRRIQQSAALWRGTVGVSDEQLAARVRADAIDILVDLKVHTAENRLMLFARKPAPVQVTWMGYPGTTGLSTIDYRLTDPHLDPPGLNDAYYTEESIRLPDSFWCYEPGSREPAVNPLPALERGAITFGSMNSFCKMNDVVIDLWSRVLHAVPASQMVILSDPGSPRTRTQAAFKHKGIDPARISFRDRRARPDYLALYHEIDIALDTFPYSGVTTSMDALLMGVPVVCLLGQTTVSRGGLTIMANLGLPELVARTPDDYAAIAQRLAGDLPGLVHLRATLRERLERSPLMDPSRFARNIEHVYRTIWQRWCAAGG
jgi:predicted O-linked N-acetylglucosamine transferase (SPINDLY family)